MIAGSQDVKGVMGFRSAVGHSWTKCNPQILKGIWRGLKVRMVCALRDSKLRSKLRSRNVGQSGRWGRFVSTPRKTP